MVSYSKSKIAFRGTSSRLKFADFFMSLTEMPFSSSGFLLLHSSNTAFS